MLYLIDARELSCPRTIIRTIEIMGKIRKNNASVKIGVLINSDKEDLKTSIKNAADSLGWQVASITIDKDSRGKYLKIIFEKN